MGKKVLKFLAGMKNKVVLSAMGLTVMAGAAQAQVTDGALTTMVKAVDFSDTTAAISAAAGLLLGIGVVVLGARKVLSFIR